MAMPMFERVLGATTSEDVDAALRAATHEIGFRSFSGALVPNPGRDNESRWFAFHDMPRGYVELRDRGYWDLSQVHRDPVLRHVKARNSPITWSQGTYVDAGSADLWDIQAGFGLKAGIAFATHLPNGRHFVLGGETDRPQDVLGSDGEVMTAKLVMLHFAAQEAVEGLYRPNVQAREDTLTLREIEVLKWACEGKSTWETSVILAVSEHTAANHLRHAIAKLGCSSKTHAVVKAMRAGWV